MKPVISLCHATARLPREWYNALNEWRANCDNPENVEYVVSMQMIDGDDDHFPKAIGHHTYAAFGRFVLAPNTLRRSCVDGWNIACQASSGQFIICIADDLFPPKHWDTEILKAVGDLTAPRVLAVDYQHSSSQGDNPLLAFSMMTRPYYELFGYANHPAYESIQADVEFTEVARLLNAVIDARHLKFTHLNPEPKDQDDVYKWTRRQEAQEIGRKVLEEHRKNRFNLPSDLWSADALVFYDNRSLRVPIELSEIRKGLEEIKKQTKDIDYGKPPFTAVIKPGVEVYVHDECDRTLYHDIFEEQEYKPAVDAMLADTNGSAFIVDLGMNVGYFTQYAASKLLQAGKKFTVHGFEADEKNSTECRERLGTSFNNLHTVGRLVHNPMRSRFSDGRTQPEMGEDYTSVIFIQDGLIGKREGYGIFQRSLSHPAHRLVNKGGRPMPFLDIEKWLPNVPVDLLKVDIEGAEELFAENYGELLQRTKRAVVEFHNGYCNVQYARQLFIDRGLTNHEVIRTHDNNTTEMFWR